MNESTTKAYSILRENESIFQLIQEHGLDGVLILNPSNPSQNWLSEKLLQTLGYTKNLYPLSWAEIVPSQDMPILESMLNPNNYTGNALRGTIRLEQAGASPVSMQYRAVLLNNQQVGAGKVVAAFKKTLESQVNASAQQNLHKDQLLRTILDTIEVGVIAIDAEGELMVFNRIAREWHGLPYKDVPIEEIPLYFNLYEVDGVTPLQPENFPLISLLKDGAAKDEEIVIHPINGNKRLTAISGARLYNKKNETIGAVIAVLDITEKKEAINKLRISEEQFRSTFENAANGMAVVTIDEKITAVNERLCEIMGYTAEEMQGSTFHDFSYPEDLEAHKAIGKDMLEGKRKETQIEKRFLKKNGETIFTIASGSVVRDIHSTPLHYVVQITDISSLKKAQDKISSILEITKDQNNRLQNFAQIVSHNLRSHSGNFEMLLGFLTEDHPELKENEIVHMLHAASGNLKETITHLNEVAQINNSVSQKLTPFNLRSSVNNTLGSINALVQKANVRVYNEVPAEYEVLSLPAYLDSILLNFATNAIKYRSSDRKPFLKFNAVKTDDVVKLSIEDNGIGIDLEKYGSKLFGMYKTFHAHEDARGIGLFITKNQIEAIGGKVEVQSEPGKGTTFIICLKYKP